ncbi:2-oxoacid:acceptor oxidoreductase family protein, partial [Chloroflexota bacterium]
GRGLLQENYAPKHIGGGKMIEIKIHGYGGQGVVVAAELLALAFSKEGKYVQAFPSFGTAKRWVPLVAFVRVDTLPIRLRCEVCNPDHLILLDSSLVRFPDIINGFNTETCIFINSTKNQESFVFPDHFHAFTVDASNIAKKHGLGNGAYSFVNTAMLGSFARITSLLSIHSICEAIKETLVSKREESIAAAREAYARVQHNHQWEAHEIQTCGHLIRDDVIQQSRPVESPAANI